MSAEAQKVVVILDASRDVCLTSILNHLSLKSGDELTLFGVVHQVINPSTFGKLLGYRNKVDSSSLFGANSRIVDEEVARKKEEYYKKPEIMELSQNCEQGKIKFRIKVQAGYSRKMVALKAAKNLRATWVILDRQMKKDNKYFLEKLSCKISRMKRDNTIELLRGSKETINTKLVTGKITTNHVSYDEMIPGRKKDENTIMTEVSSSSLTEAKSSPLCFQDEENTTNTEQETTKEQSPNFSPESRERSQMETRNINTSSSPDEQQNKLQHHINDHSDWIGGYNCKVEDAFENSICSVCKNRRPMIGWRKDFTYAELHEATERFSPKNFLSEGGFGCVYKGQLKNGLKIAVKQLKDASFQGEKEFKTEVHVLRKARHENLVMLLGSCSEGSQRLLVYEYVCNGSLDQKLSRDFGLARSQYEESDHSLETSVVGTLGYLAPEYAESGKASTKTDVYSFGVVLLQLITGLMTTDKMLGGKSLMAWARPLLEEKNYPGLIDKSIEDSHDVLQLFWMVQLAEKCLTKDPNKRIAMAQVSFV
ncbi:hypothetical protein F0562_017949 [Nyssa sinensis]|uniref:Protein kinase domain-containing protein n=1 Tax=Nyssa sinensis TaxID=561372 RepID=A0A5J4Z8P8_9ASTE|nr:hypothetical protein F0562_017949 [Nyssa sinensis]